MSGAHEQSFVRVGIFAGAFDPIHDGHLEVARAAVNYLELDKLFFMVEDSPWSDKKPVSLTDRQEMVQLATALDIHLDQLKLTDKRFDIITTLPKLEEQLSEPELYFVFGADVFLAMNYISWPDLDKLLKHYIVVFERGEIGQETITNHAKELGIVVAIIPSKHPQHRSTDVRVKPHEKQIWVPIEVAHYIEQKQLYS